MDTPDDIAGPINLGDPQEFTIRQLADIVLQMTGSSSRILHRPMSEDDPRRRQPDIAFAKPLLDWSPSVGLREGLQRSIGYFDKLLGKSRRLPAAQLEALRGRAPLPPYFSARSSLWLMSSAITVQAAPDSR